MKISKVSFIILFFILFLFAVLVGGKIPYFLFYVFAFSMLIPLIHILYSIINIKGSISLPEAELYQGDKIDIQYSLENKGFLSIPYIEVNDELSTLLQNIKSKNTVLSLDKKDIYAKTEKIKLNRRGYYKIAAIELILRDVFRIYSFKKTISNESRLLVYPKAIDINNLSGILSQTSGDIVVRDSHIEDMSNMNSFREYVDGDSMKSIHWKLSSKSENLIVKEYESSGDASLIIILDNSTKSLIGDKKMRIEDKIVDISLSIVNYSLREGIKVKLFSQDKEDTIYSEGHDSSDLKPILISLAKLKANGKYAYNLFIETHTKYLSKENTLIVISPVLDRDVAAKILDTKIKGVNIIFILITDIENNWNGADLSIRENLYQEGVKVHMIDCRTSIKEALEAYHA